MSRQEELVAIQKRLKEELGVQTAVTDVVRLIRANPKAALLIVHLLKKYQEEKRTGTNIAGEKSSATKYMSICLSLHQFFFFR